MKRFLLFFLVVSVCLSGLVAGQTSSLEQDTIAYWNFDEGTGTTAGDSVGNNDGTINGATWTTGKINSGLSFDGTNDYVEFDDPQIRRNNGFSLSLWVNINSYNSGERAIITTNFPGQGTEGVLYMGINRQQEGDIRFTHWTGSSSDRHDYTTSQTFNTNEWIHIIATYDFDTNTNNIYVNGIQQNLNTGNSGTQNSAYDSNDVNTDKITAGSYDDKGNFERHLDGFIDEPAIFNASLTQTDVDYLFSSGSPGTAQQFPYNTNFSISAIDSFDNETISNFSANLTGDSTGTTYNVNTTTGEIITPVLKNSSEKWTISVGSQGYETRTYSSLNVSSDLVAELRQAKSKFTEARTKITNTSLTDFNITINGQTFSSNTTFPSPTSYNATFSKKGWYNKTEEYNQATLNQNFVDVYDQKINITAKETLNGTTLQSFSGRITGPDEYVENFNATNGSAVVNVETNETYNIIIDNTNSSFATKYQNNSLIMNETFTTNTSSVFDKEFETFTYNTVKFDVFESDTSQLITEEVNLTILNGPEDRRKTSNNGSIIVQDLLTGSYTARFETSTYATQDLFFKVQNSSYQELDLYLDDNTVRVFFTVRNTLRGPVDDADMTIKTKIDGQEVLIGQQSTDFSGTASFQLNPSKTYTFTVVADGFSTFEGTLTPSLTEYTVTLSSVGDGKYINPGALYDYRTNVTVDNGTWTWNWKTTSPRNQIEKQQYSFEYDGVTYTSDSTSTSGDTFTETGQVANGEDTFEVEYVVETSEGTQRFTRTFNLIDEYPIFQGVQNIDEQAGTVTKALIATILTSIFVVSVTVGAGITPGIYIGAASLGLFGFFGFLPLNVTLISVASLIMIGLSLGRLRI